MKFFSPTSVAKETITNKWNMNPLLKPIKDEKQKGKKNRTKNSDSIMFQFSD